VGTRAIAAAVAGGARDVEAVGRATGAGTNCGSCRPEMAGLIARLIAAAAPEEERHAA
jgi:assimilatory nitrate reductase catalytic subunit